MIKNLKQLYARVIDKKAFVDLLAGEFNRTPGAIRSNWLSTWSIPEAHQKRAHQLLINMIKSEMRKNKSLIDKSNRKT